MKSKTDNRKRIDDTSKETEKISVDENRLRRLNRSELLEIILLLKENEKALEKENKELAARLESITKKVIARRTALKADNAFSSAACELEETYFTFKRAAARYYAMLEELGENIVEDRINKGHTADEEK